MKVLSILQALSKDEWHWLAKFAASPVHNRHKDVVRLLDYLRPRIAATPLEKLDGEAIFRALFGSNEPLDLARLHHVSNYLLAVVEDFLAWQEWKKDDSDRHYALLRAYQSHGLETVFKGTLDKMSDRRAAQPLRNAQHYRVDYLLQYEDYQYHLRQGRSAPFNLQQLSAVHDKAFIAEKLKVACILRSHQRVTTTEYDTGLLQTVLTFVENHQELLEEPAIAVYFWGYKISIEPDNESYYERLQERLKNASHHFNKTELHDIYLLLINYCIRRRNLGEKKYSRAAFEWYRAGISSKILIQNNHLSRFTFSNTVALGLSIDELVWVKDFIENYQQFLPAAQREGVAMFNLSRYFLATKEYDKALPILQKAERDDPLHVIVAKNLILKVYWETGEINALQSHLESFTQFLRRKKDLGYQRDNYLNNIRFTQKLLSLAPTDSIGKENLLIEIEKTNPLSERDWFIEQLNKKS